MIGVNISGAEYTWEAYPGSQDLAYLKSQNIELIRLPVCWEKLQPTLGSGLDAAEVAALKAFLAQADAHGMKVIVDLHNYGRYDSDWQAKADANYGYFEPGTGDPIGSAEVPVAKFADFWAKLATELKDAPGVSGYDIMNEPFNMGGTGVWPAAAQAAVDAIRAIDMDTLILVEGTQWASAMYWPWDNANLVIDDPADNLVYQAHIYFDSNGSGMYDTSYDASGAYPNIGVDRIQPFIDWLAAHNAKGMIGEFGVPDDDPRWIPVLEAFCAALNEAGMSGTYWNYTYRTDSGVPWWPVDDNKSIKPLVDGSGLAQLEVLTEYADGFDDPTFAVPGIVHIGVDSAEIIVGSKRIDRLFGNGGDDTIRALGGDDDGNAGRDDDTAFMGAGNDRMYGSHGDDALYGEAGHDTLLGDAGADRLFGGVQNDRLYGGSGNDSLYGGDGADFIDGSGGDDDIFGGPGDDRLQGRDGADRFFFAANSGADRIFDFEDDVDTLYIAGDLGFANAAAVVAATSVSGGNVLIAFGSGNSINLWLSAAEGGTAADLLNDIVIF